MSATGIVSQQIGYRQYRVSCEAGIDDEITGYSIDKTELQKGERVRIIHVVSGRTGWPEYGFCREDSGLRGVIGIPDAQKIGFANQSPANFAAAYIAYNAGKVTQLYDVGRVVEVSSLVKVSMATGPNYGEEISLSCSGVFPGSFIPGDVALVRRGVDRSAVVGWWLPLFGDVTIEFKMLDEDGDELNYDMTVWGVTAQVDSGLYYWNDAGDFGYYDPDNPPELPRAVKSYVYAIEGWSLEFVEWIEDETNIPITDKTAYQLDWSAQRDLKIQANFKWLPVRYKTQSSFADTVSGVFSEVKQAYPGETINLSATPTEIAYYIDGEPVYVYFDRWTFNRQATTTDLDGSKNQADFSLPMEKIGNLNADGNPDTYFSPVYRPTP
jgi:hypothetical protein